MSVWVKFCFGLLCVTAVAQDSPAPSTDFECALRQREIRRYLDTESRTWRIDEAALAELENDLQLVVNCADDGDQLFLDVVAPIQPPRRIVIQRELTLSAAPLRNRRRRGVFPSAAQPTVFTCPPRLGVFLLESPSATLANLRIENCTDAGLEQRQAVIEVSACPRGADNGTLELHHITIAHNQFGNSSAISVDPQACTAVQMVDVTFQNNTCLSVCGAVLGLSNELSDISIVNNSRSAFPDSIPAVIALPAGSQTTIQNLTASGNLGPVVAVSSGDLEISDSVFTQNAGGETTTEAFFAGALNAVSSDLQLQRCTFEENSGSSGSAVLAQSSTLVLRDSLFSRNSAQLGGAAMYLNLCFTVSIQNSTFRQNSASGSAVGGAVWSEVTGSLIIAQSSFSRNAASSGGGLYVVDGPLELTECLFESNRATDEHGGGIYFAGFDADFSSLTFSNNTAARFGGGAYLLDAFSFSATNVTGQQNSAEYGGCLCLVGTPMELNQSIMESNTATEYGGAIWTGSVFSNEIVDTLFSRNLATAGSGVYLSTIDAVNITRCIFRQNNVTVTGGAVWMLGSSGSIQDCLFEENTSEGFTGALQASTEDDVLVRMEVSNTSFTRNRAVEDGGAVTLLSSVIGIFSNCTWEENESVEFAGGGIWVSESILAAFDDSQFLRNRAGTGGGAYAELSPVDFDGVRFEGNEALNAGGGFGARLSNVTLSNCTVQQNAAPSGGGVYVSASSDLMMDQCSIRQNVGESNGGGVMALDSVLAVRDSTFEGNVAQETSGGAIWIQTAPSAHLTNLTVVSNSAQTFGGGIYSRRQSNVTISDSYLSQNIALDGGGGILTTSTDVNITNTAILDCTTEGKGGGAYLELGIGLIRSCNISHNFAREDGAGIYAIEMDLTGQDLYISRNLADLWGGGVYGDICEACIISDSLFEHNYALYGGMSFFSEGVSTLRNISSFNNSAFYDGGFSYLRFSAELDVVGSTVHNSTGENGAGIYLGDSRLHILMSDFMGCHASHSGGVLSATDGSFVVITDSTLHDSTAELGGAVVLYESYFWGDGVVFSDSRGSIDGGALHANFSSSVLCTGCQFERNVAIAKGGAVYLDAIKPQLLAFQFDNCSFLNNSAALGGGIHFDSERHGDLNCAERDAQCTFLALRGTEFHENEALAAGGGLLANDLNAIRVDCDFTPSANPLEYMSGRQFNRLETLNTTESICPDWTDNRAGGYGPNVASYARTVRKTVYYEETNVTEEVLGGRYIVQNHRSGSQIPSLLLEGLDALGQGPATGAGNTTLEATLWSPDRLFSGSVAIILVNGVGNISGVAGYREPGLYAVHLEFNESSILPLTLVVDVRDCRVGEVAAANGTICQTCIGDTYNFHPNDLDQVCKPCPDDAKCDTAMLRPTKGHWHRTPCSTEIQECLTERACDFDGREEQLRDLIDSQADCNFTLGFILTYTAAQCRQGYTGPLCGSCESTYGRSRSFRCEKCYPGFSSFLLVLISVLVLLLLSGFTIRSSLPSRRPRTRPQIRSPAQPSPSPRRLPPQEVVDHGETEAPVNLEMAEMLYTGYVPSHKRIRDPTTPTQPAMTVEESEKLTELSKWKAVEIFKITVNYVQVIAVAMAINVQWTDAVIAVLEAAEFLGAVTSEAATRSVDCLISSESIPRSAVRTVVNIMVPMVVTTVYFLFWFLALLKLQESLEYLIKRYILSFMAAAYLSYIAITKTAVNVLYCVEVHDSNELDVDATTRYWAVDTSLECYTGSHTVLAALVGWPVLALFSFGFPSVMVGVLLRERQKHNMQSEWLYEACGFMYRSYRRTYIFWEAIIMLRKAILAIVVAFSYPLGGNLQGVLAVIVLMVALYFQIVCAPFRSEFHDLNQMEGLSLLVSSLTFVTGLFFNDSRTSDGVKGLLAALLVCANVGLFFYFLAMFLRFAASYLARQMQADGIDFDPERWSGHTFKVYFLWKCSELHAALTNRSDKSIRTPV